MMFALNRLVLKRGKRE